MHRISSKNTLCEIACLGRPYCSILKKNNIDFAFSGKLTLEQACNRLKISCSQVLEELNSSDLTPTRESSVETIKDTINDIIKMHHSYLWKTLPLIAERLNKLALKHDLSETKELFDRIVQNIQKHNSEEEKEKFPLFLKLEGGQISRQEKEILLSELNSMEEEHKNCSNALKKLRALNNDYMSTDSDSDEYKWLVNMFEELEFDLAVHIHKENNLLHPRVRQML